MKKVKKNKVILTDSSQKDFDPMAKGGVATPVQASPEQGASGRHTALEEVCRIIQESVSDRLSGQIFLGKVDLVSNHLYDMKAYAESLRNAVDALRAEHPVEDPSGDGVNEYDIDASLDNVLELCAVMEEGARRVDSYLLAIRNFSNDLGNIKEELYGQAVTLMQEI